MSVQILQGDCRETLKTLEPGSVQTCVTSPPYWGLRNYSTELQIWGGTPDCDHDWFEFIKPAANGIIHDGGMSGETLSGNSGTRKPMKSDFCAACGAWRGEFGAEPTPGMYVEHSVWIFREVWRVLADDGTLWLNLGDSYAGSGGAGEWSKRANGEYAGQRENANRIVRGKRTERGSGRWGGGNLPAVDGLKPKDLVGIPWMVAFALRADGWYLRSEIIWHKRNPMPESVRDRPSKSHEQIFLLSKNPNYYYDADAIMEPTVSNDYDKDKRKAGRMIGTRYLVEGVGQKAGGLSLGQARDKRNRRDVWSVNSKPFKGAHFATFPPDLIEPCILAGSRPGDVVLDPFSGAGTTGAVSVKHGRSYVGCELNEDYIELTNERLGLVQPVLYGVTNA